ncbi:DinB family protein [Sedimentitalea nanhaiensis]|uniref:Uncharacterized damage-inducible protein DinB (Forms a four-helix bundle) n=1 Tax=Sedimentitalea nanhaiensis TaxID=999627 RepID=A0A1I7E008_9RHOB|nr:DinB family protein [Sedimentitalea nanhaiensis]SFU17270.1 Uncharacterized damage-inducible protein DinB (forms a four-helix bundle) [Sedimentitalea nanhaiensis]
MITREYCRVMARYNAWQNRQLSVLLQAVDPEELTRDRKAFFGSILGTLNHLLWGDLAWMSRFDGGAAPGGGIADSPSLCPTLGAWDAKRFRTDGRIRLWADALDSIALQGDLSWYSGSMGQQVSRPLALCVTHMFNHQTHHRGQVHAMMTAAGLNAPVTDLVFLPEENE